MPLAGTLCYRAAPGSETGDVPDFDPVFYGGPGGLTQKQILLSLARAGVHPAQVIGKANLL